MKKSSKKIWALLLSLVLVISLFAGCASGNDTSTNNGEVDDSSSNTDSGTDENDKDDTASDVGTEEAEGKNISWETFEVDQEKFQGETLVIWTWWDNDEGTVEATAYFEELTGATVEWVNVPWADYATKLISGVSSGTGPDICYVGPEAIPTYVNKNILIPASDYLNFENPAFTTYSPQAEKILDYFTIEGKTYGLIDAGPNTHKLYYRKDLLENAGLEDPYELFMNGEWTWDKWFELMEGVTQDMDGDGVNDIWGFDAWMTMTQFVYTNGGSYVTDGKFAVDDPKFIEALDAYRKLKQADYIWKPWEDGKDPQGNLIAGATCFNYWGAWDMTYLRENIGDDLGFVPFPKGPSATEEMADFAGATLEAVAASSQNPELAGIFLEFKRLPETVELWDLTIEERKQADLLSYGSDELVSLAYDMGLYGVVDASVSYPGLDKIITSMIEDTTKSSTQAVNEYKDAGQAIIDEVVNAK